MNTLTSVKDRFKSKIKETSNGCWEWTAALASNGYGAFFFNGSKQKAHRVSWQIYKGKIPRGLYVCHSCDNRKCVNPSHLWLGTAKENTRDCLSKNRHRIFGGAKLDPAAVLEIRKRRALGEPGSLLAKEFGVNRETIYSVALGKNWHKKSIALFYSQTLPPPPKEKPEIREAVWQRVDGREWDTPPQQKEKP